MPTRPPLAPRQRAVLVYLARYYGEHGYMPSVREVGEALGVTVNGVTEHYRALERKGYIERESGAGTARGVVVPELRAAARKAADELLKALGGRGK